MFLIIYLATYCNHNKLLKWTFLQRVILFNKIFNIIIGKVNITIKDPVPILQTKILIVGNSGVGKSTILETLISKSDNKNKNKEKTFAVDIVRHKIKVRDNLILSVSK